MSATSQPPPSGAGAGTVGALIGIPVGAAAPAAIGATEQAVGQAAIAGSVTAMLAGLRRFFRRSRKTTGQRLFQTLSQEHPEQAPDELRALVREELAREEEFQQKMTDRLREDFTQAFRIKDPAARQAKLEAILAREQRIIGMREQAMTDRALAAVERVGLKRDSPLGAYWELSPNVKKHTLDCVALAGKAWPWAVLDELHPPLHPGCPCTLVPLGTAISQGLMHPDQVPHPADDKDAVTRARDLYDRAKALEHAAKPAEIERYLTLVEAYAERWPKGTAKAGQFKPRRGGDPGIRRSVHKALRDLIPHAPRTPAASREHRDGTWRYANGRRVFVPTHRQFARTIGGKHYTSPTGSDRLYREGVATRDEWERGSPGSLTQRLDLDQLPPQDPLLHGPVIEPPSFQAPLLERPPKDWGEFQTDTRAIADDLSKRFQAPVIHGDVIADDSRFDSSGLEDWQGNIYFGRDVKPSVLSDAQRIDAGRKATPRELQQSYNTARVQAHEASHTVNPADMIAYTSPAGDTLEEALAEEVGRVILGDTLRRQGRTDVIDWAKANPTNPVVIGTYQAQRMRLAHTLDMLGVPQEARQHELFVLKFNTEPGARIQALSELGRRYGRDVTSQEVEAALNAPVNVRDFQPILGKLSPEARKFSRTKTYRAPGFGPGWEGSKYIGHTSKSSKSGPGMVRLRSPGGEVGTFHPEEVEETPTSPDTPQQKAVLRQSATARKVRARFPAGTRVDSGAMQGTVRRHVPNTNAQGGHLTVEWDNGVTGRVSPIAVKPVEPEGKPDPGVMYHVAPVAQETGLPAGTYLWPDETTAREWAQNRRAISGVPSFVHEVKVDPATLDGDPNQVPGDAYITRAPVPPSDVRLLGKADLGLVMWHGEPSQRPLRPHEGMFTTSHKQEAADYAGLGIGLDPEQEGRVHAVTVTPRNPLVFEGSRPPDAEARARAAGHDAVVVHYPADTRDPSDPMPERTWAIPLDPSIVTLGHPEGKADPGLPSTSGALASAGLPTNLPIRDPSVIAPLLDDRWRFGLQGSRVSWGGSTTYRLSIEPPETPKTSSFEASDRRVYFDPSLAERNGDHVEFMGGADWRVPKGRDDLPRALGLPLGEDVIYRGVSDGEWKQIQETGKIASKGEYNLGAEQAGLTYYSTDPRQAASYAGGFAPWEFLPTFDRPSYIIAIKRPAGSKADTTRAPDPEVGVRGEVSADQIVGVTEARPFAIRSGMLELHNEYGRGYEVGSRTSPTISLAYRTLDKRDPGTIGGLALKPAGEITYPEHHLGPTLDEAAAVFDGFEYGGLRTVVNRGDSESATANTPTRTTVVEGAVMDGSKAVGHFRRSFAVEGDQVIVDHASLDLDKAYQDKGFATAFNQRAEFEYRRLGVDEIHLNAVSIGGYAWARAGYDFDGTQPSLRINRGPWWNALPLDLVNRGARDGFDRALDDGSLKTPQQIASWGRSQYAWTLTKPLKLSNDITVPTGETMWPGKLFMLGAEWSGVKRPPRVEEAASDATFDRLASEGRMHVPPDSIWGDDEDAFWDGPLTEAFDPTLHPHDRLGRWNKTGTSVRPSNYGGQFDVTGPRGEYAVKPTRKQAKATAEDIVRDEATNRPFEDIASEPLRGDPWTITEARKRILSGKPSTRDEFATVVDGRAVYRPERQALHERIITAMIGDHVSPKGRKPVAFFTGGGMASGKGGVVDGYGGRPPHPWKPENAVDIDPDKVKAQLPEFVALNKAGDPEANLRVYEEAWDVAQELARRVRSKKLDVIVDGVGDTSAEVAVGRGQAYVDAGYSNPRAVYVYKPVELAIQDAAIRRENAERTGKTESDRYIPPDLMRDTHARVSRDFPGILAGWPGELQLYDTNTWNDKTKTFDTPTLILSRDADGKVTMVDQAHYDEFLAEGKHTVEAQADEPGQGAVYVPFEWAGFEPLTYAKAPPS